MPDTWTIVTVIPNCDLCTKEPAYADAAIPGMSWAYMCRTCFMKYGASLGLGRGQELLLKPPDAPTTA